MMPSGKEMGMNATLLLAEESITIRKVVNIVFRKKSVNVSVVSNRKELFAASQSLNPDIILISSTFPDLRLSEDLALLSKSSNNHSKPIILLAHRGEGLDAKKARSLGATSLLFKPLDNRELLRIVEKILSGEKEALAEELPQQPTVRTREPAPAAKQPPPQPVNVTESLQPPSVKLPTGTPEERARVLMEIIESYLNENVVLLTNALAKNLAPKIAPEVASRIMEEIDLTQLPGQIMELMKGIIQDLVPRLAESLISREIEQLKNEAVRLMEMEEEEFRDD